MPTSAHQQVSLSWHLLYTRAAGNTILVGPAADKLPPLFREGPDVRSELLMGWLLRSPVLSQENHLLVAIKSKWVHPGRYLAMFKRFRSWNLSEAGSWYIASEYASNFSAGQADLILSQSIPSVESGNGSGAFQRTVPPPLSVKEFYEMFFGTDESLMPVGEVCGSNRSDCCPAFRSWLRGRGQGKSNAHTLWISMNHTDGM